MCENACGKADLPTSLAGLLLHQQQPDIAAPHDHAVALINRVVPAAGLEAPISPSTSASISSCSTAPATARRKSPSPACCSSPASGGGSFRDPGCWAVGDHATRAATSSPSRALPRRRALG